MANEPHAPEDPREAGAPRTTGPTRAYERGRIRVLWDAGRCIHVGRYLPDEAATEPVSVEVRPNGPLYLRGRVRVARPGGDVVADELRVALCRCGASQNKPFYDNSHRLIGFRG